MKTLLKHMLVVTLLLPGVTLSLAAIPRPSVVYYGLVRDPYGWPYQEKNTAIITLSINGKAYDTCIVDGFIAPNVNYCFRLTAGDTTSTGPYDVSVVHAGDKVSFTVAADDAVYPVIQMNDIPDIGTAGSVHALNLTAGHDTDGDGFPDEWEQDLLAHSKGAITNISEISPTGDFDNDEFSNLAEYTAGTIPYWSYDFLSVAAVYPYSADYHAIDFFTVPGIAYYLIGTTQLEDPAWLPVAYKTSPAGTVQHDGFIGSGYLTTLYIPATNQYLYLGLQTK